MKRLMTAGIALACLTAAAPSIMAQQVTVRASVPFEFNVGPDHYPAGEYVITREAARPLLAVQNSNSRTDRGVIAVNRTEKPNPGEQAWSSTLEFSQYGNRRFLRRIWVAGTSVGIDIPATKSEKQAQLMSATKAEQVVLQARR